MNDSRDDARNDFRNEARDEARDAARCAARLLASALHDMRNVLAVIRESNGLAQDLAGMAGADRAERLKTALAETRRQVLKAAELTDALDSLAQALGGEAGGEAGAGPCDLSRLVRVFCVSAARHARAARLTLVCAESEEPVWVQAAPLAALRPLLEIFDLAASVGGQATLAFRAGRRHKAEGVVVEVREGPNADLVLSALTGSPLLAEIKPGLRAVLLPWQEARSRFFLSFAAGAGEQP